MCEEDYMDDKQIIDLFWSRSENALNETRRKYNPYLRTIAMNVLGNNEDCEECLSDTYMAAWNQIPPDRPTSLSTYLGRIVRCISIDYFRKSRAQKRYSGLTMLLSELEECMPEIPDKTVTSSDNEIGEALNCWLRNLDTEKCVLFVRRYWHGQPLSTLAKEFGISYSKLASMMLRLRNDLHDYLEKEGISI
jgi:RNA polymerase sigma factor (sigma-70 family)